MYEETLYLVGMLMATVCSWVQCGFVSVSYEDPISGSSANIGQLFTKAFTDNGYASEGLQQSFLYRGEEIAFVSANDVPYAFREGRQPAAIPATLDFGFTDVYLFPIYGVDFLLTVFVTNCTVDPVEDYDGNSYNTVLVDYKCWTKENLRSLHYMQDGSLIPNPMVYMSDQHPNDALNLSTYGCLYNRFTAVKVAEGGEDAPEADLDGNVQGICPTGWHVPSHAEWTALTNYVSGISTYQCGGNTTYIAKALASTSGWGTSSNTNCDVQYNQSTKNKTGFSGWPAGYFGGRSGQYYYWGNEAHFWSSTEKAGGDAYTRFLRGTSNVVGVGNGTATNSAYDYDNKHDGYSVRCVKN